MKKSNYNQGMPLGKRFTQHDMGVMGYDRRRNSQTYFSRGFISFVKRNKRKVVEVKKLIDTVDWSNTNVVTLPGIKIEKRFHSYPTPQNKNRTTFCVTVGRKKFFVKKENSKRAISHYLDNIRVLKKVNDYLRKRNFEINGVNVRVVPIHALYIQGSEKAPIFVSEFIKTMGLQTIGHLPDTQYSSMKTILIEIANKVSEFESWQHNAYYRKKDNTLLIMDHA